MKGGGDMLVLKSIGLVILFAIIAFFVAEISISAIMTCWVYPYALSFVVVYLEYKGRGYFEDPNTRAQGFNIIIRTAATLILYLAGAILMIIFIPAGPIKSGCMLGWIISGCFSLFYEFCVMPLIGRFDHMRLDEETQQDVAVFKQLDGEEFELEMEFWSPEDYPEKDRRYAVMRTSNYWAFYPLWLGDY